MRDADVRSVLCDAVSVRLGKGQFILVPEVDIRWSVPARADALLVGDRICGFEIKSDVDSIARLPRQIEAYGQVVERAFLVVGERHRQKATDILPDWWHVWVAREERGVISLSQTRRGRLNPDVNPLAVLTFMNRAQLTVELSRLGDAGLSLLSVDELRTRLVVRLGRRESLRIARKYMLNRPDWRRKAMAMGIPGSAGTPMAA